MDLLSELIQNVRDDKTIGSDSTLYPEPLIKRYINRAYRGKVAAAFRWPELEDAKKTSTVASQEYYDYPQAWQPDSIWKLTIEGVEMEEDPLVFKDYLYETENDFPDGKKNIWSNQWRRFFVRIEGVAPTTNGNNNISVWGQKVPDALSGSSDTTIFSYSFLEGNEAIVLETVAMLKNKGEDNGQFLSLEAKGLVVSAWNKIKQNQAKYEKTRPFFDVPDLFSRGNSKSKIGDFDI